MEQEFRVSLFVCFFFVFTFYLFIYFIFKKSWECRLSTQPFTFEITDHNIQKSHILKNASST